MLIDMELLEKHSQYSLVDERVLRMDALADAALDEHRERELPMPRMQSQPQQMSRIAAHHTAPQCMAWHDMALDQVL